jgi:hypothetical protein
MKNKIRRISWNSQDKIRTKIEDKISPSARWPYLKQSWRPINSQIWEQIVEPLQDQIKEAINEEHKIHKHTGFNK